MMSKPSLSFYTNIPTPYQQDYFRELAKIFTLTVVYYAATESNRNWSYIHQDEYKVILLKDNGLGRFMQKWIIDFHFSLATLKVACLDKSEYRIVGGAYWTPNAAIALIFGRLNAKFVAYFSEPLFESKSRIKYLVKWLFLRMVNLCCNAVLCIGEKAATTFNHYKVNIPKYMVPYSINPGAFIKLDTVKLENTRRSYKNKKEVIVLSSGALIKRKGMDILLKAVKSIQNDSLRLIIIGDGPMKKELQDLSKDDKRVLFAGHQLPEDIPYFLGIADIFVLASRYDGWAVVVNEAIAANIPLICSDKVGAAVELIKSRKLGILCESENVEQFASAIQELVTDAEKRSVIKENMKQLVPKISSVYNAQLLFDIVNNKKV